MLESLTMYKLIFLCMFVAYAFSSAIIADHLLQQRFYSIIAMVSSVSACFVAVVMYSIGSRQDVVAQDHDSFRHTLIGDRSSRRDLPVDDQLDTWLSYISSNTWMQKSNINHKPPPTFTVETNVKIWWQRFSAYNVNRKGQSALRAKFYSRYQRDTETLTQFGTNVCLLASEAFGSSVNTNWLVKNQFITVLSYFDIKKRLRFDSPKSFREALKVALDLEGLFNCEYTRNPACATSFSAPPPVFTNNQNNSVYDNTFNSSNGYASAYSH